MNSRLTRNSFIYLLIIAAVLAISFTLFSNPFGGSDEIPISEVVTMTAAGRVDRIEVNRDKLNIYTTIGEQLPLEKRPTRPWWKYWRSPV